MSDVRQMLAKKMESVERRMDVYNHPKPIEKQDSDTDHKNTGGDRLKDLIGAKVDRYFTKYCGYDGSDLAVKYMGKPISEIMQEERKLGNLLRDAEQELDKFLSEQYENAKAKNSWASLTEKDIDDLSHRYVEEYVIRSCAGSDEEGKAAHEKYMKLDDEVSRLRVQHNAVLLAKADYIECNPDLIRELQDKRRIEDLKKSGLLRELGLVEKDEENNEEVSE